jgi:PhzF family phenazine biosynthesis protein
MGQRIVTVDAFTAERFRGNPAAVCVLERPAQDAWMQDVAREMNLAETAFLVREGDAFRLRWFTPTVEVDLCGHATLASAHVLWEDALVAPEDPVRFLTRSGELGAELEDGWVKLDFPATPPSPAEAPEGLLEALGLEWAITVGKSRFDWLVEVDTIERLRGIEPDFRALARIGGRGVIVTCVSEVPQYQFVSRFFAPAAGVDEDPATGSSHCCLAPFWALRLGRPELVGYQASARGGEVRVAWRGDRVQLAGRAVTVMRGELV